jgi:hypothetical protein
MRQGQLFKRNDSDALFVLPDYHIIDMFTNAFKYILRVLMYECLGETTILHGFSKSTIDRRDSHRDLHILGRAREGVPISSHAQLRPWAPKFQSIGRQVSMKDAVQTPEVSAILSSLHLCWDTDLAPSCPPPKDFQFGHWVKPRVLVTPTQSESPTTSILLSASRSPYVQTKCHLVPH